MPPPPDPPAPAALGRGVVVTRRPTRSRPRGRTPRSCGSTTRCSTHPGPTVTALHHAWVGAAAVRRSRSRSMPSEFRAPESITDEPWQLGARFEVWRDRLHFLVWANTYDARDGKDPIWWWARKAARVGRGRADRRRLRPRRRDAPRRHCPRGSTADRAGALDPAALGAAVVHAESVELGRLTVVPEPVPVTAAAGAGPARRGGARCRPGPHRRARRARARRAC